MQRLTIATLIATFAGLSIAGCPTTIESNFDTDVDIDAGFGMPPADTTPPNDDPDDPGSDPGTPPSDGVDPPPAENLPPTADAGDDFTTSGRKPVRLDGTRSSDPEGAELRYTWEQVSGPTTSLRDANTPRPRFNAPASDDDRTLVFRLTVSDGEHTATDDISIVVTPPIARVSLRWFDASQNTNMDLDWTLPNNSALQIQRNGWGEAGVESASQSALLLEDGIHQFSFSGSGGSGTTEVEITIDCMEYQYTYRQRVQLPFWGTVALDMQDTVPHVIFNGFESADASGAGGVSDRHALEVVAGWRDASNNVHLNANVWLPNGNDLPVMRRGWTLQNVEHIAVPERVALEDGIYTFGLALLGNTQTAEVAYALAFRDTVIEYIRTLRGRTDEYIGFDLVNDVPHLVFNGWADDDDAAIALSGARPLEAIVGWRNASENVNLDLDVRMPNGNWLPISRFGWSLEGFEHVGTAPGVALQDGVYEFHFEFRGNGHNALVEFQARFADWTFQRRNLLQGNTDAIIRVELRNGQVTELGNTWP